MVRLLLAEAQALWNKSKTLNTLKTFPLTIGQSHSAIERPLLAEVHGKAPIGLGPSKGNYWPRLMVRSLLAEAKGKATLSQ